MKAIILAAGISSRMRPLTDRTPKPMLRIAGKPLIEWVILSLRRGGITDILVTTHYLPTIITDYFGDGARWGVKISYTYEPDRLDTAGSLLLARDWIDNGPFLICGGHFILPELEVEKLISFHFQKNAVGTICFKPYPDTALLGAFGQGALDAESRLVAFREKPEVPLSHLVHTTYQVYQASVLDLIPNDGSAYSIPDFLIPTLLGRSLSIYGYVHSGELINVSTIELYERALRLVNNGVLAPLQ